MALLTKVVAEEKMHIRCLACDDEQKQNFDALCEKRLNVGHERVPWLWINLEPCRTIIRDARVCRRADAYVAKAPRVGMD